MGNFIFAMILVMVAGVAMTRGEAMWFIILMASALLNFYAAMP